jgi:hypothetical protein
LALTWAFLPVGMYSRYQGSRGPTVVQNEGSLGPNAGPERLSTMVESAIT